MLRKLLVLGAAGAALYGVGAGWFGTRIDEGTPQGKALPESVVRQEAARRMAAARDVGAPTDRQILFGDFHVHTTFSNDAFVMSLPVMQGSGMHPPADACDYVRYCSGLDFWSINDHAISLDTQRWRDTRDAIQQCNALTSADDPDVVSFLGFEWTQANSDDRRTHWGHKNVIYRDTSDAQTPPRPIYARLPGLGPESFNPPLLSRILNVGSSGLYTGEWFYPLQHNRFMREMEAMRDCPDDVDTKDLPPDCREAAEDPATLFRKLDESGLASIVIPHGNTWGLYTPPGSTWDKQLKGNLHDPDRQFLVEVFSGHGNSEEYRDWRAIDYDENGNPSCPPIRRNYVPGCQRAAQIIHRRCTAAGESAQECDRRADEARQNYVATTNGHRTVPGVTAGDWLDSNQCTDCFQPSYGYRPGGASQYALAIGNFDEGAQPRRFRFGFMASSDNHSAKPGTGYKEYGRIENTEAMGPVNEDIEAFVRGGLGHYLGRTEEAAPRSRPFTPASNPQQDGYPRWERAAGFLYTGGLVAVHSDTRRRGDIWNALHRKQVYGTSGDRILLWFDLLNGQENGQPAALPMGSESRQTDAPRFRVRAVGAFKQEPGCPEHAVQALGAARLEQLCGGECYNPSTERKRITRIEVIRIRPQVQAGEPVRDLVEDVWRTLPCQDNGLGCVAEFSDPDFAMHRRDTVYYVRAIEEPSAAVNGDPLRCEYDERGQCVKVNLCYGSYRTGRDDDCLSEVEERAWSSPIFVDYGA